MRTTIIFVIACTAACTSVDSANIKTAGINPSMHISASSDKEGAAVEVVLHVGDSLTTFVDLDSDETVTATVDGEQPVKLSEGNILGLTSYGGSLDTKTPGTNVTIAVTRTNGNDSAPKSTVTMTEGLTLTKPAPGGTVSRADDDIAIEWTDTAASQDGVTIQAQGDCIDIATATVQPGETTATFAKGTLKKKQGDDVNDECPITVSATRQRNGTLDPAWGGGSIFDTFSSSAQLTSKP